MSHIINKNKFLQIFLSLDKFAQPLTLTHNGRQVFKTKLGSIMTIIQYALLLAFFIVQIREVHEMSDVKLSTYSKFVGYDDRNRTENISG